MDFREIYDAYLPFVWRSLRRLGVPEADTPDAAQEVFVVVHRRLGEFEGRAKLTTWLFRICFHVAQDRSRRAHVRREVFDESGTPEHADSSPDTITALERREDLRLFESALERMDLEQRAVFALFELEAMSGEDIAQALGIPLGTVYSRLRAARDSFRKSVKLLAARRASATPGGEP